MLIAITILCVILCVLMCTMFITGQPWEYYTQPKVDKINFWVELFTIIDILAIIGCFIYLLWF